MGEQVLLRVSEVFRSLQGESTRVGLPTVFVRLTGCPLRCTWCDTTYAFTGGESLTVDNVLDKVKALGAQYVCVTGGEPLAQKHCHTLLSELCNAGYSVSLETSGALDVSEVDPRVSRIVDLKAPSSGEAARNVWRNLALLGATDELKCVVANREDYEWALERLREHAVLGRCVVLFSPVQGVLEPADLASWVLDDGLPVRFQLQLHKILWGNSRGK